MNKIMTCLPEPAAVALCKAGFELIEVYGWALDEGEDKPIEETDFFRVLAKHLGPLLDADAYKQARIAALKTELKLLEG